MSTPGRFVGWLWHVLAWSCVVAVAAVLTVAVLVPRLAGATPYTVLTGSMAPGLPAGSLVVVKPVAPDEVGVGSVITYQLESGRPAVATHRVVAVETAINGDLAFVTQGDANEVADAAPVRPVQVKGELWYSVPYLGHVNTLLSGNQRQIGVYVIGSLLLAYAGYMFTSSIRERRRRPVEDETSTEPVREDVVV